MPRVVTTTAELREALDCGLTADQIEVSLPENQLQEIEAARREGYAEGRERAIAEAMAGAVLAERARIKTLKNVTLPGFEHELQKAIDTEMEPGAYALHICTLQATLNTTGAATRH